jgi:hypothetical protein
MKTSLTHVVAYVVAALVAISAWNPVSVAALVGPKLAPYVAPFIAFVGALVAFLHSIFGDKLVHQTVESTSVSASGATTKTTTVSMVPKQGGFAHRGLLFLLSASITVALVAGGCAQIKSFVSSPTGQTILATAIPVAVEVAEGQGVPAATIKTICADALAADAGTAVTLGTLTAEMNTTLTKVNSADQAAISIVEVALNAAINSKLAGNASVASVEAAAADVFTACVAAS